MVLPKVNALPSSVFTWPLMCYPGAGETVDSAASPHAWWSRTEHWLCAESVRISTVTYSLVRIKTTQTLCCQRISRNSWKPPSPSFLLCHRLLFQRSSGVFSSLYSGNAFGLEYCVENYWKGWRELLVPLLKQSERN